MRSFGMEVTMKGTGGQPECMDVRYELPKKKEALERYMKNLPGPVMVAFSGGVDSSLLLAAACRAAANSLPAGAASREAAKEKMVYAATVHTSLHPVQDADVAARVASELGASHLVVEIDELKDADIADNPTDRCYRCKKFLFSRLQKEAEALGVSVILEGSNADDTHVYRPGLRAVQELGIKSPLLELGLTKREVRALASEYGISVADRPSAPCLATRFPYGTRLSRERMQQVDEGEQFLRALGFYNVRIRAHGDTARIEVDRKDMEKLLERAEEVVEKIRGLGFSYVTLDLEGFRSGSMDINLPSGR